MSETWKTSQLGDCLVIRNDKSKQIKSSEYELSGVLPVIDQSEEFICGYTNQIDKKYLGTLPVVVFGDHTRHVKFIDFEFVAGADGTQILQAGKYLNQKYFYYLIVAASQAIGNYGYDRHFKHLKKFETKYPINRLEQQKIAEILSTIDQTIAHTEALIQKYQQIKAGLMHDLFTRGITPDGKLRTPREQAPELYRESAIGWIPKEWDVTTLKTIYKNPIRDFGSFSSTNLINFLEDGVPFIKSEMIKEEEIDWKNVYYISVEVHKLLSKSYVEKDQILFSKIGSALGKAVLYHGERGICNSNAAIAKIEINEQRAIPRYVEMFLNSRFAKKQFELMIISLLPRINLGDINKLLIQLPSIKEQKIICDKYFLLKKTLRAELDFMVKLQKQKSGLIHDLLTGKVPVTLSES
jgi:type I restriction enzyme, S subunit